jgi:hypothetical protein
VLVPLGLAVGLGWSEFSDKVVRDPAEGVGPSLGKPETTVYSCSPPFEHEPRIYLGFGFREPPCSDDARLRRRIATCLFVGAGGSSLALAFSRLLRTRAAARVVPVAP